MTKKELRDLKTHDAVVTESLKDPEYRADARCPTPLFRRSLPIVPIRAGSWCDMLKV